jgi:hypothetical protein
MEVAHKITQYFGISSVEISEFVNTVLVTLCVCILIRKFIQPSFFISDKLNTDLLVLL